MDDLERLDDLGRFGIFLTHHKGAQARQLYRDELCSPLQLVATASSKNAAASTACQWLDQMDRFDDATTVGGLIIRDRDAGENLGIVQWRQGFSGAMETWHCAT